MQACTQALAAAGMYPNKVTSFEYSLTLLPVLLLLDRLPVYLPAVLVRLLNAQVTALWCVYC